MCDHNYRHHKIKKILIGKSGLSLIEMLATLVIFAIFTAITVGLMVNAVSNSIRGDEAIREQVALRQAMLSVTRDIRLNPFPFMPTSYTDDFAPDGSVIKTAMAKAQEYADGMYEVTPDSFTPEGKLIPGGELKRKRDIEIEWDDIGDPVRFAYWENSVITENVESIKLTVDGDSVNGYFVEVELASKPQEHYNTESTTVTSVVYLRIW